MQNEQSFLKNPQIFLLGICIVIATVLSSLIFSRGLLELRKFSSEVIAVTGSAEKVILSDYVVWRVDFFQRNLSMEATHTALKKDLQTVKDYLHQNGIPENEIVVLPAENAILYEKNSNGSETHVIEGYQLSQRVEIRSKNVERITEVSRRATDLIEKGILLNSRTPDYFYTALADLKVEMLSKATQNARERALKMTEAAGNHIGVLRNADMGVFQITPANSTEISDWGVNDTSSLEKKVTAVVHASFAIS